MSLHGIKLITFDVTNTLLRFRIPPYDYYASVARCHGFKGTGVDLKNQLHISYKDLSKQHPNFGKNSISWNNWWSRVIELTFQGRLPTEKINEISQQLIEDFKTPTCWKVADGGTDLIRLLKKFGIIVGVISNFDPRLHDILTNMKIHSCFDFILTSYEVGVCKPDKKIFECAQDYYGNNISSQQCLHIGDDLENDYNGAKAVGWHALLITNKSIKLPYSKNVYPSLQDLCKAIESDKLKLS
ncbi:rhythmically expressed gene 2 protein-like [Maniola hyperantus]|uniref:rhythmically expressed gene 2 protein-like n=1 Tax=Aphantopus hyperantus TaxID=2795564 RepID=UPI0015688AB7|nr:rhythmically expressed gene 2 protein-like [Maniola hyperantus]